MARETSGDVLRKRVLAAVLPNGSIPFHHIQDVQTRETIMKLNENVVSLSRRVSALEAKMKGRQT